MKKRVIFITLLLLNCTFGLRAENIFFNHIRGEHGLSHPTVYSIYQDELGFIWIGTRYGLNRYDGNKITVIDDIGSNIGSLYRNNIKAVCGNRQGELYVLSGFTLVTFDLKTLKTKNIHSGAINAIGYGEKNLWACDDATIYALNSETGELDSYFSFSDSNHLKISCINQAKIGSVLYVGTKERGLFAIDKNKKISTLIPNISVVSLYEDSKQNIWVATLQNGVFIVHKNGEITHITHNPKDENSITDNYTRAVCEDEFGNYWIGTFNGLCRYNMSQNKFTTFNHSEDKPYSIGSSSVWGLMKDNNGTIWLGSYYGGVDYFNPEYSFFNFYGVNNEPGKNLSSALVGRMREDNHGNLWIGTEGGGVNCMNRKTGEITSYINLRDYRAIKAKNIKSFYNDTDNDVMWIGAVMDGLIRLDLKTQRSTVFKHNPDEPTSLLNNYILDIVKDENNLYLATNNSVVVFDIATSKCEFLLDNAKYDLADKQIRNLMMDSKRRLWFCASNGVFRYDTKDKSVKWYQYDAKKQGSIGSIHQSSFFEDRQGNIWIGSAGTGLSLYNENSDDFKVFNVRNSDIIDDYIADINETLSGYLIIATNSGISFFDHANNVFMNFFNQTIFPISSINDGGLCVAKDGEIFLGSTTGLFSFFENIINIQPRKTEIIFTDFFINNVQIEPGESSPLKQIVSYSDYIGLSHNQNSISFEYTYTNYIDKTQQDIEYRLEGFDQTWLKANNRNVITYTNLNPGEYTMRIRALFRGKVVTESQIKIGIKPPIYATWYAYIFYFLLAFGIIFIIARFYTSSVKLKVSLNYAQREREQTEELNQSKLRFFTNISHEFRTPLTLIINQAESLLQSLTLQSPIYNKLLSIHKNAKRMGKLVNELLDFRKQEMGFMQLKVAKHDIVEFVHEIFLTFNEFAHSRNISFIINSPKSPVEVWFDVYQMEKVIYNLLSNAFNFTKDSGEVSVSVRSEEGFAVIEVSDSGVGIQQKDIEKIFDRFYQSQDEEHVRNKRYGSGTGIGLALSKGIVELHHGSISVSNRLSSGAIFMVKLPLGDQHFDQTDKTSAQDDTANETQYLYVPEQDFIIEAMESISTQTEKCTILIVEDVDELLEFMAQIFSQIYRVVTAKNGLEGLQKAQQELPDIIVSDVMMPEMNGIEMCGKLKTNILTSHIPIILLTARTTIEYTIEGYRIGADDYLTKPFDTKLLITRCNNLINNRRLLQAKFSHMADADINMIAVNSMDISFMERAMEIVNANIDNQTFDVHQFSQEMMMGRTAFFQKIKGITGQTPNEFVTSIRLKRSLQMLKEYPELSVSEISYRLGFTSPSYFTKCFKDLFGTTPVIYRKDN